MTVREYVGARYVPLYIGEWDNTKAYEPLSIVTYQGDSYTSRQSVPVGIDITNETYWVISAAYNAQVEQYRQEVLQYNSRISTLENDLPTSEFDSVNTIKKYIDDLAGIVPASNFDSTNTVKKYIDDIETGINAKFSKGYVGNYGAVEKDDTVDWQSIIDRIAAVSNTLDFGSGNWYINEELTIPSSIYRITGNGAIISVNRTVSTLFSFYFPVFDNRFPRVSGLKILGNENVDTVFQFDGSGNGAHVSNCDFANFNSIGIESLLLGALIENCTFANYGNAKNTAIGIKSETDSIINSCKFFHIGTGIEIGANSEITSCYFFNADYTDYVYAFDVKSGPVKIAFCEFDCIPWITKHIRNEVSITDSNFYWNDTDDTLDMPHYIFNNKDSQVAVGNIELSRNSFNMSATPIDNVIYSFGSNMRITYGYISENNSTNIDISDTTRLAHFAISCGFKPYLNIPVDSSTDALFLKFTKTDTWPESNPAYQIHMQPNNAIIDRFHGTSTFNMTGQARDKSHYIHYFDATQQNTSYAAPFYICGHAFFITRIVLANGAYNMSWNPGTVGPDTQVYTKQIGTYLG